MALRGFTASLCLGLPLCKPVGLLAFKGVSSFFKFSSKSFWNGRFLDRVKRVTRRDVKHVIGHNRRHVDGSTHINLVDEFTIPKCETIAIRTINDTVGLKLFNRS